jgi:cytochrome c-type biogenesis protein
MIQEVLSTFFLGLATPLTAACVLPLYPGFLSYLSNQFSENPSRRTYALFGVTVVAGVMSFMLILGVFFTAVLQQSLSAVIQVVSPIAFTLLGIFSIVLIFDLDFQSRLNFQAPEFENPLLNGFSFGFFFGAIIIPCNPAFISIFFARSFLFTNPVNSLLNFLMFGIGIGFPLLVFSLVSSAKSQKIISFITNHESKINKATGAIMLAVSLYYLTCVFHLGGPIGEIICSLYKTFFQLLGGLVSSII